MAAFNELSEHELAAVRAACRRRLRGLERGGERVGSHWLARNLRSALAALEGEDPHEVDHSWTDDGTGHCEVCGEISADLEAKRAQALDRIAAMVPTDVEWRSANDFMLAVAEILDGAGVERPATYDEEGR